MWNWQVNLPLVCCFFILALDVTDERVYFYNNNENTIESVTFAGEDLTKVVTQGKNFVDHCLPVDLDCCRC